MSEEDAPANGTWRRTSKLGLVVQAIVAFRNALLPIAAVLFGSSGSREGAGFALLAIPAIIGIILLFSYISWRHLRYRLGETDISVESGLLSRAARSVPYERIQDVSLEQSLVPRLFGMVEVKFETGAGGKDELKLAYVDEAEGAALRQAVRARKSASPGKAAEPEAEHTETLFAMDLRRLLTFGLFEFSLIVFAVVGGAAQQFEFLLPFELSDPDTWTGLASGPAQWLAGFGFAAQAIGILFAVAALGVVGLATGLARTVLRDYGFLLEDTPRGLRRRRGLLTRTDTVMPVHRVQALAVTTGIIRRRFGWHALEVISLAQDSKTSSHTVVPFANMEEIGRVVRETGFHLPAGAVEWHRPSAKHRFDSAVLQGLPLGGLAAALFVVPRYVEAEAPFGIMAVAALLVGGFLALRQHFLWRFDRHAIDAQQIYVRRGWLAPRLDIASRIKLQSVEVAQGPIARARGYATLHLGIAGGTLAIHGIALGEARRIRAAALESIGTIDFSQLPGAQGAQKEKAPATAGALSETTV